MILNNQNFTEIQQVHNVLNNATCEDDDSIEDQPTTEIERYTENEEQYIGKENELLTTNFYELLTTNF